MQETQQKYGRNVPKDTPPIGIDFVLSEVDSCGVAVDDHKASESDEVLRHACGGCYFVSVGGNAVSASCADCCVVHIDSRSDHITHLTAGKTIEGHHIAASAVYRACAQRDACQLIVQLVPNDKSYILYIHTFGQGHLVPDADASAKLQGLAEDGGSSNIRSFLAQVFQRGSQIGCGIAGIVREDCISLPDR